MKTKKSVAILMRKHAYAGREFARCLSENGVDFDVVSYGTYPVTSTIEEERCAGQWNPPLIEDVCEDENIFHFEDISAEPLQDHLADSTYDIGIQGGNGIIKPEIFESFGKGLLNFHPGDLPKYRGSSAPEYQILDGHGVFCTCHLVDEGLDSGDIIQKTRLNVDMDSYHSMRSSIYPEMAKFVSYTISKIKNDEELIKNADEQNTDDFQPREYIGDEKISHMINEWNTIVYE